MLCMKILPECNYSVLNLMFDVQNKIAKQQSRKFTASAVVGIPMGQSAAHQGSMQHSHPMLGGRRGQGRRLPPTPCKPSTLQLRPGTINFPKLNASPTHVSKPLTSCIKLLFEHEHKSHFKYNKYGFFNCL